VYVTQKLPLAILKGSDRIPKAIDGIPTDVIVSPVAFLLKRARVSADCSSERRTKQRPIRPGISVAHERVTAGTIAYFCKSTRPADDPESIYLLSNNHVLADFNQGKKGDRIYQPGPADGGAKHDAIAELARFVKISSGVGASSTSNNVDAALAALIPGVKFKLDICKIGRLKGTEMAVENLVVRMHGRTSGLVEGVVSDESIDALVGTDPSDLRVCAMFENQIRIEQKGAGFGKSGDSGAMVVNRRTKKGVGLFFAAPDDYSYGYASPIEDVLEALECELL
jgi:hypothetical protein